FSDLRREERSRLARDPVPKIEVSVIAGKSRIAPRVSFQEAGSTYSGRAFHKSSSGTKKMYGRHSAIVTAGRLKTRSVAKQRQSERQNIYDQLALSFLSVILLATINAVCG